MNDINKNYESNADHETDYGDSFSIGDLIEIIKLSKKQHLATMLAFFIASSILMFSTPNEYASSTILSVVDDSEAGGSGFKDIASRYGGLASLAGVSISDSSASKSDLVLETLKSRDFFKHISEIPGIFPSLVASQSYDAKENKLVFNEAIYDTKKEVWLSEKPSLLEAHRNFLNQLTASKDKRTGFIFVSFKHISPEFAFLMTDTIISELNNIIRKQHLSEASRALSYLNDALRNTADLGTKSSITTLVEAQLKVQMIASVRKQYIVRTIDKPYLPEWKVGPSRLRFIALTTIAGFILSFFISLYLYYFRSGEHK